MRRLLLGLLLLASTAALAANITNYTPDGTTPSVNALPKFSTTGGATVNSAVTDDGTTLSLGTAGVTAVNIGHAGSTTTITGGFSCPSCAFGVAPGAIFGLGTARASNTTLTVATGKATDEIGGSVTISVGSPLTLDFGTTGANGLDTGAFTADQTYHVFVISKADGTAASLASLSLTPSLPATYVYRRRVGSVLSLAGPVLFSWVQYGDEFLLSAPYTEFNADPVDTSAHTLTLVRCPTGIVVEAILVGEYQYSTYFSPLSLTDADPYGAENVASDTGGFQISNVNVWTNTSAQFRYRVSIRTVGLGLRILGRGWIDRRGKDG